jgi:hypothetical protein
MSAAVSTLRGGSAEGGMEKQNKVQRMKNQHRI